MPAAALLWAAACRPPAAGLSLPATRAVAWVYDVELGGDGNLAVQATFSGGLSGGLEIESGAERFVDELAVRDGTAFRRTDVRDPRLVSACASACTVRYRFRLSEAAHALSDVDLALAAGPTLFAPPSTWLVHPASAARAARYRFHVRVPPGQRFATGVRLAAGADGATFEAPVESFEESSFAGFGPLRVQRIAEPSVDVVIAPGLSVSDEAIVRWTKTAFDWVAEYIGRPPSDSLSLFVLPGTSEVMRGKTLGGGGPSVFLRVGTAITEGSIGDDWVLCHELVHVGFPRTETGESWFSEGLASYVEPVIRARAKVITNEKFWGDLVEGLPQGLPAPGDHGLENNDEWGRVYWGGALYFLLADLAIRERTAGARSLEEAVRGVVREGGDVEAFLPMSRILAVGDRATGTHVLEDLYERLAKAPGTEDLDGLWAQLGVVHDGAGVRFDDRAPSARIRESITASLGVAGPAAWSSR